MKSKNVIDIILNLGQYFGCMLIKLVDAESVLNIVVSVITILTSLVIIIPKIWAKIKKWREKAMKDGKITAEEVEDLIEDIKPEVGTGIDAIKKATTKKGGNVDDKN